MQPQRRLIFANQLRGFAAIIVVISHLNSVFWRSGDAVATFIGAPALNLPYPITANLMAWKYLNLGTLGVGIFFLISGFVIPLALNTSSRFQFLTARFFRIYPTYIISLLTGIFAVWLTCRYWGNPYMWDARDVFKNMLLIHTISGSESIDMVNWTLAIEIKFYIIVCLMATSIRRAKLLPLILFSVAVFILNMFTHKSLGAELFFMPFMFVGILFNFKLRGMIGNRKFILSASMLCLLFFGGWQGSAWPDNFWDIAPNYAFALAIFALAYLNRDRFRKIVVLDFLANISYPLYLTHSLVGYSAMRYMYDIGMKFSAVAPITMILVLSLSYAIHRLVELPSTAFGKRRRLVGKLALGEVLRT